MVDVTKVELTAQDGATAALNAHRSVVDRLDEAYERFERSLQRYNSTASAATSINSRLNDVSSNAVRNIAQSAAAYLSLSTAVGVFFSSVNQMDHLDDMSQKLALNTKSLQENAYAGKMTGVELNTLTEGQKKLQLAMVAAAAGGKEEAAIFKAMGIDIRDANGQMRASESVMLDIADVMVGLEDGALKTALAAKVLGKSTGPEMVAYLNQGSEGIRRMADEANALGGVMSGEALSAAAEFNDQVDRLKTVTQGAANQITSEMLPAISDLIERFIQGKKAGMGFWEAAGNSASITVARAMGETYGQQIRNINREIDNLKTSKNPFSLFGNSSLDEDVEKLGKVKKVLQEMQAMRALEGNPEDNEDWFDRRYGVKHRANASAIQASLNTHDTKSDSKYESAIQKSEDFIAQIRKETAEVGATTAQKKEYEVQQIASQMKLAGVRTSVIEKFKREAYQEIQIYDAKAAKYKAEEEYKRFLQKATEDLNKAGADAVKQLDDEIKKQDEYNAKIGKSKAEIELVEAAKLNLAAAADEELAADLRNAAAKNKDVHDAYVQHAKDLEEVAKRKRELAGKKGEASALETAAESAKKASEEWKRTSDDIERSLNDSIIRGFEGGEDAVDNFIKSTRNQLLTAGFRIPVKFISGAISSVLNPGAAESANFIGSAGQGANMLGSVGNAFSIGNGISTVGNWLGSSAISGFGSGVAAGMGSTAEAAMLASAKSAGNATLAATTGSEIGSFMASAGPYLAAAAAIYAIAKSLDDSGTMHTGGAATASASGSRAIDATTLGFMSIDRTKDAEDAAAGIAGGIVSLLNSTAQNFGKQGGYSAATAFADDTSDDGAWGALQISRGDTKVLDWNDQRASRWAPREYGDGEYGRGEYIKNIGVSVRQVLDTMDLPGWAGEMLAKLGETPAFEDVGKTIGEINATQSAIVSLRDGMDGFAGLTDEAIINIIKLSGGIDALGAQTASYAQNFLSEAERMAPLQSYVTEEMTKLGYASVTTHEQFKDLVDSLDKSTESGAAAFTALMSIQGAYDIVADAAIEKARTSSRLEIQLMRLSGDATGALARERQMELETLDVSLRPLQERIWALEDEATLEKERTNNVASARATLTQVYEREAQALRDTASRHDGYVRNLRSLRDALTVGALSNLSPYAKYTELSRRFDDVVARRNAGDESAMEEFDSVAQQFLEASQAFNASGAGYASDLSRVLAETERGVQISQSMADTSRATLSALEQSVSTLVTINDNVISVEQAIVALSQAMTAAGQATPTGAQQTVEQSMDGVIESLYRDVLGRQSDASGKAFWVDALRNGVSYDSIRSQFYTSAEYLGMHGSHADGLDRVPFDNYRALLHKDETVLTAPKAKAYREGSMNKDVVEAIREQTSAINQTHNLLERLINSVDDGKVVSTSDMRSLKQHLSYVLKAATV